MKAALDKRIEELKAQGVLVTAEDGSLKVVPQPDANGSLKVVPQPELKDVSGTTGAAPPSIRSDVSTTSRSAVPAQQKEPEPLSAVPQNASTPQVDYNEIIALRTRLEKLERIIASSVAANDARNQESVFPVAVSGSLRSGNSGRDTPMQGLGSVEPSKSRASAEQVAAERTVATGSQSESPPGSKSAESGNYYWNGLQSVASWILRGGRSNP